MASAQQIKTPLTEQFGIKHPIMLAGMNVAAGPELAAAVTNAGGIGVIGGVGYTPTWLKQQIAELKSFLNDKNAPFGVDLLLPKVGGGARKTNTDYTNGQLPELIDIIIESGAKLFVSAVGVPPVEVVQKLHSANIIVAGIIGHPKHAPKVLEAGVDMIIFQGGEGGGHTGDVPLSIIAPRVVDICRGRKSPLTGNPIITVAAGGIFNGRGLAASICYGADGVWVGTRFVASNESGAPKAHKEAVLKSTHETDIRTIIFTGRPLRLFKTPYVLDWESRPDEIKRLTDRGIIPVYHDLENDDEQGSKEAGARQRFLLGKCAAVIEDIKPAKQIVDEMVDEAVRTLREGSRLLQGFYTSYLEEWQSYEVNEDQLLDYLEPLTGTKAPEPVGEDGFDEDELRLAREQGEEEEGRGGLVLDWHTCDVWPERWVDLVVVLRCDHSVLWDRLEKRGYPLNKIQENNQAEIMGVVADDARSSYPDEAIVELTSEEAADVEENVGRIVEWIHAWRQARGLE